MGRLWSYATVLNLAYICSSFSFTSPTLSQSFTSRVTMAPYVNVNSSAFCGSFVRGDEARQSGLGDDCFWFSDETMSSRVRARVSDWGKRIQTHHFLRRHPGSLAGLLGVPTPRSHRPLSHDLALFARPTTARKDHHAISFDFWRLSDRVIPAGCTFPAFLGLQTLGQRSAR